jgi:hypothetical protein
VRLRVRVSVRVNPNPNLKPNLVAVLEGDEERLDTLDVVRG